MEGCSPQIQPKKIKGDESKKKKFFVQKTNLSVKDFLLFADLCKKKICKFFFFFLFVSVLWISKKYPDVQKFKLKNKILVSQNMVHKKI